MTAEPSQAPAADMGAGGGGGGGGGGIENGPERPYFARFLGSAGSVTPTVTPRRRTSAPETAGELWAICRPN